MIFLPDTNACVTLLRERNPHLVARWQATKATDTLVTHNTPEFSRIAGLKLEDWER